MRLQILLTLALAFVPTTAALGEPLGDVDTALDAVRDDVREAEEKTFDEASTLVPAATGLAEARQEVWAAVDDALACRSAYRIDLDYWVGDVTDERHTEWDALATIQAELIQVVGHVEETAEPATQLINGLLAEAPADASTLNRLEVTIPVDVHLEWDEEYVEWERIRESIYVVAPVAGVPVVMETVCDPDVVVFKHVPAPDPGAYDYRYLGLGTPRDGWAVVATSAWATPLLEEGEAHPDAMWRDAYAIAPSDAVRKGQQALDALDVVLYELLLEGTSESGEDEEAVTESTDDAATYDPRQRNEAPDELTTHSATGSIVSGGIGAANLTLLVALAVAALALAGGWLRRK